jgi:hypothetical protein
VKGIQVPSSEGTYPSFMFVSAQGVLLWETVFELYILEWKFYRDVIKLFWKYFECKLLWLDTTYIEVFNFQFW